MITNQTQAIDEPIPEGSIDRPRELSDEIRKMLQAELGFEPIAALVSAADARQQVALAVAAHTYEADDQPDEPTPEWPIERPRELSAKLKEALQAELRFEPIALLASGAMSQQGALALDASKYVLEASGWYGQCGGCTTTDGRRGRQCLKSGEIKCVPC